MQLPNRSRQAQGTLPKQGGPRVLGAGTAAAGAAPYGPQHARYSRFVPDLRPGEAIVALLRRHPAALLMRAALPGLLLAAWLACLLLVLPFVSSLHADPLLNGGFSGPTMPDWVPAALLIIYIVVAVLLALWVLGLYLEWRGDWLALTTRRLIMMDKLLFLHETRREVPLSKVQNVVAGYPRLLSMSLDFGDLTIDTAGAGVMTFKDLPHPRQMREAIFVQQQAENAHQPPPEERRKAALRNLLQPGAQISPDPLSHSRPTPSNGYPRVPGRGETQLMHASLVKGYKPLSKFFPFAPQRAGRNVVWHRHWAFLLKGLFRPGAVYLLALSLWLVLRLSGLGAGADGGSLNLGNLAAWAAVLLAPVCLLWALWNWEDWRDDTYRLDGERLYHVESLPFGLREQSSETLVGRITDVSYSVHGPLAHILNFGDVVIRTPGESTDFVFAGIPRPREVQGEIMARVDEARQRARSGVDEEIEAWIQAYDGVKRETMI